MSKGKNFKGGKAGLIDAVKRDQVKIAKELIWSESIDIGSIYYNDERRTTLLMIAAPLGYYKMMMFLIESGANFHQTDINGKTALDLLLNSKTIFFGYPQSVKVLSTCHNISGKILEAVDREDLSLEKVRSDLDLIFSEFSESKKGQSASYTIQVKISDNEYLFINPAEIFLDADGNKIGNYLIKNLNSSRLKEVARIFGEIGLRTDITGSCGMSIDKAMKMHQQYVQVLDDSKLNLPKEILEMIVDYTEQKDKEILFKPGKSIKSADAKKVDKKKETTLSS